MPTETPTFPDEEILPLAGAATLTSAYCTGPASATDDDPATAAVFAGAAPGIGEETEFFVNGADAAWQDTGIVIPAGAGFDRTGSGSYAYGPIQTTTFGGVNADPGAFAGKLPAVFHADVINGAALVLLLLPDGVQPAPTPQNGGATQYDLPKTFGWSADPSPAPRAIRVTPEQVAAAVGAGTPARVWAICNDGAHNDNPAGGLTLGVRLVSPEQVDPRSRYLVADWVNSRFVTRIRLRMSGAGSPNAALALRSGFTEGADVPVAYLPLPSDESGTDATDEITLDPPVLADGVVFYPDYLATSAAETATVNLYQLQVYTTAGEEMPNPTQTTTKWSQVGVQAASIYPWGAAAGPYDATTVFEFGGNQSLDMGDATTIAVVTGGETVFELAAFETARQIKFKFSAQIVSLRALAILQGGTFAVDAVGSEVQYLAPNKGDRVPYFRFVGRSTNGDGTLSVVLPKCKISSAPSYNLTKDGVSTLEFEFTAFWDPTHVRQDGATGAIVERIFGATGETTYVS